MYGQTNGRTDEPTFTKLHYPLVVIDSRNGLNTTTKPS